MTLYLKKEEIMNRQKAVTDMRKDLRRKARKLNVILKPIPNALLRTMKYAPGNPIGCDTSEKIQGRRAKPYQKRFYSKQWFKTLIEKTVQKRGVPPVTICGSNVDEYLIEAMCLVQSDQTRGVVALRLVDGNADNVSNQYEVVGLAFYYSFSSTTKWKKVRMPQNAAEMAQKHPENSGPQHLRGKSYWEASSKQPLQWKGTYANLNLTAQPRNEPALNNENYGELNLVCSSAPGVGSLMVYYALYDMWRREKNGAQRYDGVVLSTASQISKSDVLTAGGRKKSEDAIRKLQLKEMRGDLDEVSLGLARFYERFGFKRAKAVHRGSPHDYWASTEPAAPAFYMILRGREWSTLPTKVKNFADSGGQVVSAANRLKPGASIKTKVCSKGERGTVLPGLNTLRPPNFTADWSKRRNVRNTQKWSASKGGRGAECLY